MCSQRWRNVRRNGNVWRESLAVATALCIGPAPMHLQVWIRCLAAEDLAWALGHGRAHGRFFIWLLLLLLLLQGELVGLCIGRGEVRLAVLEMLNLPGGVFGADKAAVEASYLVARISFRGCISDVAVVVLCYISKACLGLETRQKPALSGLESVDVPLGHAIIIHTSGLACLPIATCHGGG